MKKECVLFYSPENEALARKIAATSSKIELGEIKWSKFNDGFPNLFVKACTWPFFLEAAGILPIC